MVKKPFVLAIDQGTSSTKTLVLDAEGKLVARGMAALQTKYLPDGFVEQDPEEIYQNVLQALELALAELKDQGYSAADIEACGISNQRETFVLWDASGQPLYPAVVWQCKRSVHVCREWKQQGWEDDIRERTGLLIDPYFSGSKAAWLFQHDLKVKQAIEKGEAHFGTVDSWLLYKLTGRKAYKTDHTNASRTLFFNIHTLDWDGSLLQRFGLEALNLPEVQASSSFFGETDFNGLLERPIPVNAMIGDSHAAAFGEGCFDPGTAKATLGTGCSILMNIGAAPKASGNGMVTTICWSTESRVDYALEGVIVTCGATIEWLKNELNLFQNSRDTEAMAMAVESNQGVYLIPAFSGLGAPHWDMTRRASINGMGFGTTRNHIVRAALESIPYQIKDVVGAMEADSGLRLQELMVNGGITSNRFVLQFLADLLRTPVVSKGMPDVSALGAGYLAGLKAGIYSSLDQLQSFHAGKQSWQATRNHAIMEAWYEGWRKNIG